jgi:hypothetical protein
MEMWSHNLGFSNEEDILDKNTTSTNNMPPLVNGMNGTACKGVQVNTCCSKAVVEAVKAVEDVLKPQNIDSSLEDSLGSFDDSSGSLEDSSDNSQDKETKGLVKNGTQIVTTDTRKYLEQEQLNGEKNISKGIHNMAMDRSEEHDINNIDAEESEIVENRKISIVLSQDVVSKEEIIEKTGYDNLKVTNGASRLVTANRGNLDKIGNGNEGNDDSDIAEEVLETMDMAPDKLTVVEPAKVRNGGTSEKACLPYEKAVAAEERSRSSGLQRLADIFRTQNLRLNAFLVCIVW